MQRSLTRIAVVIGTAMAVLLSTAGPAVAGDTYPSQHWARARCYTTKSLGTFTVMSSVYMNRADGYLSSYNLVGGYDMFGNPTGGNVVVADYTPQWLYYRVVVVWYDANGKLNRTFGNWIARQDALGDGTDGISTYFQMPNGSWKLTGYTGGTSPWDVSLANGSFDGTFIGGIAIPRGRYYAYGEFRWGPIYQTVPGPTKVAFPGNDHFDYLGQLNCSI